jgi:hypothetical protein
MQQYTITITVYADADPTEILEHAIEAGEDIARRVEDYGGSARFLEEEVAVKREDNDEVYGGDQYE